MARPLRIDYEGALHHTMNRGTDRCLVFLDNQDRLSFLGLLADITDRFGVEVHAYCLMGNHYHLLVATPRANLSRAMRHLDGVYTQRFNRRHDRDGPLMRGRFASVLVQSEVYQARLSAYIHLNPVRARLVRRPGAYRWSSYPAFVGKAASPDWLVRQEVLAPFGNTGAYQNFVESGVPDVELERFYGKHQLSPVLGTKEFAKRAASAATHDGETRPSLRRIVEPTPLSEIGRRVADAFDVSLDSLQRSTRGQRNPGRLAAIALGQRVGGATLGQLAERYGLGGYSGVSSAIGRFDEMLNNDPTIERQIRVLVARLNG